MTHALPHLVFAAAVILAPLAALAEKAEKPDKTPRPFTLLFVGGSAGDGLTPTLTRLQTRLESVDPQSAVVVFTGNYAGGELPLAGEAGRERAEHAILAHVAATRDFVARGGKVYFLAGHEDFAEGGTKAVRRMRKFLNRSYRDVADDLDVMPEAACGTPVSIALTDNVGLLLVNSQWWMQDWVADPEFNEGCEVKTRSFFDGTVMDTLRDYRNRRLIIASHHPLGSYGRPLSNSPWEVVKRTGLVQQQHSHPVFHSYSKLMLNQAERNGSYVFASGHDANLQYLVLDKQVQIVSGTSAHRATSTVGAGPGDFAQATPGWVELAIEADGAGDARFFAAEGEPVFQIKLPHVAVLAAAAAQPAPPLPEGPFLSGYTKKNVWDIPGFLQLVLGSYYSDAYLLKLPYPVLDLKTEQGGLDPFKVGGGLQTNSIRLHDANGGDWAMRAVTKDSSRLLPYAFNQISAANRLLDHGFTATHPEAALAMAPLATAVGILHLRPRLMYLPDQDGLGEYRGFISDELVMLEQRPNEMPNGMLPEHLGGHDPEGRVRFLGYDEAAEKLLDKPATHQVDQEEMLRARLLDVLVGDWDRHRGQWRFAVRTNEDGTKTYTPIALDRDQVFANYDGLGLMVARMIVPQARSLQPFTGNYGRMGWLNYNARDVDALMLNKVTRERWMAIAAEVQAKVTDAVIAEALATWHPETYALDGARIAEALKLRRDKLLEAADDFFALINQNVDVLGSSHDDVFDLWFEDTGTVKVSVRGKKDAAPYFERLFQPHQTAGLRLYGLEGDDVLTVHGTPHNQIDVLFVGGEGKDLAIAGGPALAKPMDARTIRFYDSADGAQIDPSIRVHDELGNLARFNQYEPRENHEPDYAFFMPGFLINPDDGVYLGGKFTAVFQGYKKAPFAARHELSAYFATATLGAAIEYRGLFPQSASLLDQQVDLALKTPTYTRNFYGYTNNFVKAVSPDYYRVRQARYEGRYGLSYGFGGDRSRVGAQLVGQAIVTEATPGRFVTETPDVTPKTLGPRYFGGARLFAETNTFDSLTLPRRGVALHASVEGRYDVEHGNQFSTNYKLAAATAIPLDRSQRFVILTRASLEGIVGDHPFYFAPTLGDTQLRAYRRDQLAGDLAFAHTTDLRVDVFRIYSVLPGTIGFNLSVDHGRVIGSGIGGKYYHLNYGGGVWWSIVDLIGVSVNYHRGLDDGYRVSVAVGPLFSNTGF